MRPRFIKNALLYLVPFLLAVMIPMTALGQDDEEELKPHPDNPDWFFDAKGEIVDEFGLIIRLFENKSICIRCHYEKEKYEALVLEWDESNHSKKKVTCAKCHGGNPKGKNLGESKNVKTTDFRKVGDSLIKLTEKKEIEEAAFDYCGQCHGIIYKKWDAGIHGKRTGMWNGKKDYFICMKCHNPHNPTFKQIEPMPAPIKPKDIVFKK